MTNEKIKELEARIIELEELVQGLNDEIDVMMDENRTTNKMARAICELQEELRRKFPDLYLINKINAPTMVGMQ
tara:strand:- start:1865 stop:2086 length:222 start_codon:yes stop_codon:yes gene_type:complete